WAGEEAAAVGTVAHRVLRRIAEDGPDAWNEDRVKRVRPGIVSALAGLGMSEGLLNNAAERVESVILKTLASDRGRWLLGPREAAENELAVSGVQTGPEVAPGQVVRRAIDRTFIDNGVRWIIDYKTGGHEGGRVDEFLDEQVRRHRPQLEGYAELMHGLQAGGEPLPIRLGLFFPALSGWRDWAWEEGGETLEAGKPPVPF
ncbi:MAG: PD-(D/E)XK nuclease family protein, partial [Leptospirillia bacterium]